MVQVVVFRGEGGEEGGKGGWVAGVVQSSNGTELVVHVMVRTGGKVVNEPDNSCRCKEARCREERGRREEEGERKKSEKRRGTQILLSTPK